MDRAHQPSGHSVGPWAGSIGEGSQFLVTPSPQNSSHKFGKVSSRKEMLESTYVEVSVVATSETAEGSADFLFSEGALGLVTEDLAGEPRRIRIRASFPGNLLVGPSKRD